MIRETIKNHFHKMAGHKAADVVHMMRTQKLDEAAFGRLMEAVYLTALLDSSVMMCSLDGDPAVSPQACYAAIIECIHEKGLLITQVEKN